MSNKKILLISTYPIKNPQHGGQKRVDAIYRAYKRDFAEVRHTSVFFGPFYADHDPDDITLSKQSEQLVMRSPLTGDIVCGEAIFNDDKVKREMTAILLELKPDVIHVEQPFAFIGLKPLLQELGLKPKLVFGSQNIEAPMKREILEEAKVSEADIASAEKLIAELEKDCSAASDLVVACTKSDAEFHRAMGAKKVILAPNGVTGTKTTKHAQDQWRTTFERLGVRQTALFVASAHPPNWKGFLDMIGKGLGFLPVTARIVAAGSVSDYFEREVKPDALNIEDATFWLRAYSTGRLSEGRLSALIAQADIMLLPITEGGGSNLKTAEAILADKKVVATHHALRSFEWFKDFPNVWIADSKEDFQKSIAAALKASFVPRTKAQVALARQVDWQHCLEEMLREVAVL